ncbi:MAG: DEAD/DEAH box helicase, partial [Archangium sp.]|nr:DEAD/DEAH box helicase [Archangium sp.]
KRGVDIVIATPGRALDHIERKTLLLDKVKVVVLDEADEMLDMGFEEDLQKILGELPKERQTALFSATLPSRIAKIAEKHLKNPVRVTIAARSVEAGTLPKIRQSAFVVQRKMKEAALMRVLEWETPQSAIIFCRTRTEVESLNHVLMRAGYEPAALHGGLTQEQRDQVLRRFKDGAVRVLVATDVAARGLHVEALSHVVNFDLPTSPEVYVHRIGRTGRAGKEGVALSFLDPREQRLLRNVEFQIKGKVPLSQVPTRAQLDARRADTMAKQVQGAISDEGVAPFIELAKKAAGEDATMEQVAGAAMMLLQRKLFPPHESDAADFGKSAPAASSARGSDRGERGARSDRGAERGDRGGDRPPRERRERSGPREGMTALSLSLGEHAGIRPQDLVGAIANEAGIPSRSIQGVRIEEMTSRVEVPTESVHDVIKALHATRIRGRKVRVTIAGAETESAPPPARAPRKTAPRAAPVREMPPPSMPEAAPDDEEAAPVEAESEDAPIGGRWMISDELESELDEKAPPPSAPRPVAPPTEESESTAKAPRMSAPRAKVPSPSPAGEGQGEGKSPGRFAKSGERFGKPRAGDRFGKSDGGFDKPRAGDRFGDKPRGKFGGDRGGSFGEKSGGRFGDKPRGKFGDDRGGTFGDKSRGTFGDDRGGRFGDKPRGKFGDDRGGRFGDKPRGKFGDDRGGRFGDKPRGKFGDDRKGKSDNFGRRPPGTFGGEGAPAPRPSAGRFSSDKSRAEGFSPRPRFGDRPGTSSQRSGGQAPPRRREFGPPSGPETGPARFSAPTKKKHGRMGR